MFLGKSVFVMLKFLKKNSKSVNDVSKTYQDMSENLYKEIESGQPIGIKEKKEISFDFSLSEKIQKELEATELKNYHTLPSIGRMNPFGSPPSLPETATRIPRAHLKTEHRAGEMYSQPFNDEYISRTPNMFEDDGPSKNVRKFEFKSTTHVLFPTVETTIFVNQARMLVTAVIDLSVQESFIDWQFLLQHNVQPKTEDINGSKTVKATFNTRRSSFEIKLVLTPQISFQRIVLNPLTFEPLIDSLRPLANPNFSNPSLPSVVIGHEFFQKIREPVPYLRNSKDLTIRRTIFGWIIGGIVDGADVIAGATNHSYFNPIQFNLPLSISGRQPFEKYRTEV